MPLWETPDLRGSLDLNFIRIRRKIFVGHSIGDGHMDIAEMEELNAVLDAMRISEPTEVDAGLVRVRTELMFITADSSSLQLPVYKVRKEARETTIIDFSKQAPEHIIVSQNFSPFKSSRILMPDPRPRLN